MGNATVHLKPSKKCMVAATDQLLLVWYRQLLAWYGYLQSSTDSVVKHPGGGVVSGSFLLSEHVRK